MKLAPPSAPIPSNKPRRPRPLDVHCGPLHVASIRMAEAFEELRAGALACLVDTDPQAKSRAVARLAAAAAAGAVVADCNAGLGGAMTGPLAAGIPGRPLRPALVAPRLVGRRSMATVEG